MLGNTENRKVTPGKKRKKSSSKSVKYWTLITIESENCDPKRLTPRQQLAYIAKRAGQGAGGSQLMSDFRQSDSMQHYNSDGQLAFYHEGLPSTLSSTQENMNADLYEIAAESAVPHSFVSDIDELIGLAEAAEPINDTSEPYLGPEREAEEFLNGSTVEVNNNSEEEMRMDHAAYLTGEIADFMQRTSAIQQRRLAILGKDILTRNQFLKDTSKT